MAADVYTVEPHVGRGGWTWYTGSSSWMYRVGIEWILGLKLRGDRLHIDPCIPASWEGFNITYRYKGTIYDIKVENPDRVNQGVREMWLDDLKLEEKVIPLGEGDGKHRVRVIMGAT